jgi:DNA-directed RNA polymerase specialized sigma24 family protein
MSNAEVARWLGKTEGAVKSLQHRALRALGKLLGAEELGS